MDISLTVTNSKTLYFPLPGQFDDKLCTFLGQMKVYWASYSSQTVDSSVIETCLLKVPASRKDDTRRG